MAKKSTKKEEPASTQVKDSEEIDDFEDSEFEDSDIDAETSVVEEKAEEIKSSAKRIEVESEFEEDNKEVSKKPVSEILMEEMKAQKPSVADEPFKYLSVELVSAVNNQYEFRIYYQSHGFLSLLVSELLSDSEVEFAAYRATSLDQPLLKVVVKPGVDVKKVLKNAAKRIKKNIFKIQEQLEKVKI
jgi:DNA-directed RNA polymerase subunit L